MSRVANIKRCKPYQYKYCGIVNSFSECQGSPKTKKFEDFCNKGLQDTGWPCLRLLFTFTLGSNHTATFLFSRICREVAVSSLLSHTVYSYLLASYPT